MNEFVRGHVERLRAEFEETTGTPFAHFYCPVLFRDEDVPLCEAHIVNQAFAGAARERTVQRADVDSFFGSRFEADFVDVEKFGRMTPIQVLTDPAISKRFNARVLLEGNPVEHFVTRKGVPEQFAQIQVGGVEPGVPLGLKMDPTAVRAAADRNWEVEVSRDVTLEMLVSTIKAAHLTLFRLLGYRYALSAAGHFVGRDLLGEFFLRHGNVPKQQIREPALEFFKGCVNMVRPLISNSFGCEGTVSDRTLFMCMGGSGAPWAFLVFVRTGEQRIHAVMVPVLETPDQVDTFLGFLGNSNMSVQVATWRLEDDTWQVNPTTVPMHWPKDGGLYS